MKKILFVMDSMDNNGAVKSLINLLQQIDYLKYDVSLFVLDWNADFYFNQLPKEVKVLPEDRFISMFFTSWKVALPYYLKNRKYNLAFYKLLYKLDQKRYGDNSLQYRWKKISILFKHVDKNFDVCIAFNDYYTGIFALQHVKAKKYIGWNHNLIEDMHYDYNYLKDYYNQINVIATISEKTAKSILKYCGVDYKEKISIIGNISNECEINKKANMGVPVEYNMNAFRITSVGRLTEQKGYLMFLHVVKRLIIDFPNLIFYIIGEGEQRKELEKFINNNSMQENVVLLGARNNPYPYIKYANIYVQPSRSEGYGIAIDEAKILEVPVICTEMVEERYSNWKDAILVSYNENEWYEIIKKVLYQPEILQRISSTKKEFSKKYLNEFYNMIESI